MYPSAAKSLYGNKHLVGRCSPMYLCACCYGNKESGKYNMLLKTASQAINFADTYRNDMINYTKAIV